jgi:hypothetical protein
VITDAQAAVAMKDLGLIRRRLEALPRVFPTKEAYVQDFSDTTTVLAGGVWQTARTLEIPAQKRAIVKYLAMDTQNAAAAFLLRFRFVVNGTTTINYASPPYMFSNVSQPSQIWLDVDQQNVVELQFKNLDNTTSYTVNSRMIAWSWDLVIVDRGR